MQDYKYLIVEGVLYKTALQAVKLDENGEVIDKDKVTLIPTENLIIELHKDFDAGKDMAHLMTKEVAELLIKQLTAKYTEEFMLEHEKEILLALQSVEMRIAETKNDARLLGMLHIDAIAKGSSEPTDAVYQYVEAKLREQDDISKEAVGEKVVLTDVVTELDKALVIAEADKKAKDKAVTDFVALIGANPTAEQSRYLATLRVAAAEATSHVATITDKKSKVAAQSKVLDDVIARAAVVKTGIEKQRADFINGLKDGISVDWHASKYAFPVKPLNDSTEGDERNLELVRFWLLSSMMSNDGILLTGRDGQLVRAFHESVNLEKLYSLKDNNGDLVFPNQQLVHLKPGDHFKVTFENTAGDHESYVITYTGVIHKDKNGLPKLDEATLEPEFDVDFADPVSHAVNVKGWPFRDLFTFRNTSPSALVPTTTPKPTGGVLVAASFGAIPPGAGRLGKTFIVQNMLGSKDTLDGHKFTDGEKGIIVFGKTAGAYTPFQLGKDSSVKTVDKYTDANPAKGAMYIVKDMTGAPDASGHKFGNEMGIVVFDNKLVPTAQPMMVESARIEEVDTIDLAVPHKNVIYKVKDMAYAAGIAATIPGIVEDKKRPGSLLFTDPQTGEEVSFIKGEPGIIMFDGDDTPQATFIKLRSASVSHMDTLTDALDLESQIPEAIYLVKDMNDLSGTVHNGAGMHSFAPGEPGIVIYRRTIDNPVTDWTKDTMWIPLRSDKVTTVGAWTDVKDEGKEWNHDKIYLIDDMDGAPDMDGYKFKAGEKGYATINSTGEKVYHPLPENVWRDLKTRTEIIQTEIDSIAKTLTTHEGAIDKNTDAVVKLLKAIEDIESELSLAAIKVDTNTQLLAQVKDALDVASITVDAHSKAIRDIIDSMTADKLIQDAKIDSLVKPDYTKLTKQSEFVAQVLKDNLIPGTIVKMTLNGKTTYASIVGLDGTGTNAKVTYLVMGDWTAADGTHVTSLKKEVADGTLIQALKDPTAGLIQSKQFKALEPAKEDKQLVRFAEFKKDALKPLRDLLILVNSKLGNSFVIVDNNYASALGKLLDHFGLAIPAGSAPGSTWETVLKTKIGDRPLPLLDATGAFLGNPIAQWVKTEIIDKLTGTTTTQPITIQMTMKPVASPVTAPPTIATKHDLILLQADKTILPSRLVKEIISLTNYQETDGLDELQTVIDTASGAATGDGFQVVSIVKQKDVAANLKFGDGSPLNLMTGVGYSKKEHDDADKLAKAAQKLIDDAQDKLIAALEASQKVQDAKIKQNEDDIAKKADINLENVANALRANKWVKFDAAGKIEFVDAPTGGTTNTYTKAEIDAKDGLKANTNLGNVQIPGQANKYLALDAAGRVSFVAAPTGGGGGGVIPPAAVLPLHEDGAGTTTAADLLARHPAGTSKDNIYYITNAKDNDALTWDNVLVYKSVPSTAADLPREWLLLNPKHSSQNAPSYQLLTDSKDHTTSPKTWTENGVTGYWQAAYAEDNLYSRQSPVTGTAGEPYHLDTQIGNTMYDAWIGTPNLLKGHNIKIADIDHTALKDPHIRLSLLVVTGHRGLDSAPTDIQMKDDMADLVEYYYNPTPQLLAKLQAHGIDTANLGPTVYSDIIIDTAVGGGKPIMIAPTSAPQTSSQIQGMRLWFTKDRSGNVQIFLNNPGAYDPEGETGPIFVPAEIRIETIASGHAAIATGTSAATTAQINNIINKMSQDENKEKTDLEALKKLIEANKKELNKKADSAITAHNINEKADQATTYTKVEVDGLFTGSAGKLAAEQAAQDKLIADLKATSATIIAMTDGDKKLDTKIDGVDARYNLEIVALKQKLIDNAKTAADCCALSLKITDFNAWKTGTWDVYTNRNEIEKVQIKQAALDLSKKVKALETGGAADVQALKDGKMDTDMGNLDNNGVIQGQFPMANKDGSKGVTWVDLMTKFNGMLHEDLKPGNEINGEKNIVTLLSQMERAIKSLEGGTQFETLTGTDPATDLTTQFPATTAHPSEKNIIVQYTNTKTGDLEKYATVGFTVPDTVNGGTKTVYRWATPPVPLSHTKLSSSVELGNAKAEIEKLQKQLASLLNAKKLTDLSIDDAHGQVQLGGITLQKRLVISTKKHANPDLFKLPIAYPLGFKNPNFDTGVGVYDTETGAFITNTGQFTSQGELAKDKATIPYMTIGKIDLSTYTSSFLNIKEFEVKTGWTDNDSSQSTVANQQLIKMLADRLLRSTGGYANTPPGVVPAEKVGFGSMSSISWKGTYDISKFKTGTIGSTVLVPAADIAAGNGYGNVKIQIVKTSATDAEIRMFYDGPEPAYEYFSFIVTKWAISIPEGSVANSIGQAAEKVVKRQKFRQANGVIDGTGLSGKIPDITGATQGYVDSEIKKATPKASMFASVDGSVQITDLPTGEVDFSVPPEKIDEALNQHDDGTGTQVDNDVKITIDPTDPAKSVYSAELSATYKAALKTKFDTIQQDQDDQDVKIKGLEQVQSDRAFKKYPTYADMTAPAVVNAAAQDDVGFVVDTGTWYVFHGTGSTGKWVGSKAVFPVKATIII